MSERAGEDGSDVIAQAVAEGRRRCGNVLPEGFTITAYKNGTFYGKYPRGDIRGP